MKARRTVWQSVYLSADALSALRKWLKERDAWEEYLIYSPSGKGRHDVLQYSPVDIP